MRRLQESILYLIIHLTIVFNIERLDIAGPDTINLSTSVYLLTMIAVIMILSFKWMRNLPKPVLMLLWAGVYFLVKLVLIPQPPLVGSYFTYLSLTEIGLFLIAVYLTQNLALNLEDVEQAVKNIAFASNTKVRRSQETQERINAEIYRSRRFQRSLSIIVIEKNLRNVRLDVNKVVQDAQRTFMEQYVSARIAKGVADQLRQTDILFEHDKGGKLIVVSPDTDEAGAKYLVERLGSLTQSKEFSLLFGTATFPDDGLTFEQLLIRADVKVHQQGKRRFSIGAPKEVEKDPAVPVE